ncbi:MAG: hypothetical protein L0220_00650 [Acidobacteria bacterium]|nr:hypothetical protein [Acidobacteriota bacterium]
MIRYLLGELTTEEQVEMETEYFSDPEKFNLLQTIENDLIEGYVSGKLANGIRARFEARYLSIPARREQVQFFQSLVKVVPLVNDQPLPARAPKKSEIVKSNPSWWQSLAASFSGLKLSHRLSYAAAILIISGGVTWQLTVMMRQREQAEQARIALQQREQDLKDQIAKQDAGKDQLTPDKNNNSKQPETSPSPASNQTPVVATVTFTLPGVRSVKIVESGPRKLRIKPETDVVRIIFNLPVLGYSRYGVSIQTLSGQETWNRSEVKSNSGKRGETLVFNVPPKHFSDGNYLVVVNGNNQSGKRSEIGTFYLDVTTGP